MVNVNLRSKLVKHIKTSKFCGRNTLRQGVDRCVEEWMSHCVEPDPKGVARAKAEKAPFRKHHGPLQCVPEGLEDFIEPELPARFTYGRPADEQREAIRNMREDDGGAPCMPKFRRCAGVTRGKKVERVLRSLAHLRSFSFSSLDGSKRGTCSTT